MSFFIYQHGSQTEHDCACTFSGSFQGTDCFVQFCLAAALFRTASPHLAFLSARWKWLSLLSPFFPCHAGSTLKRLCLGKERGSSMYTASNEFLFSWINMVSQCMCLCLCRVWSGTRGLQSATTATYWVHNPFSSASNGTGSSSG